MMNDMQWVWFIKDILLVACFFYVLFRVKESEVHFGARFDHRDQQMVKLGEKVASLHSSFDANILLLDADIKALKEHCNFRCSIMDTAIRSEVTKIANDLNDMRKDLDECKEMSAKLLFGQGLMKRQP